MNYPKDHRENLEWRRKILVRASEDLAYREQVRELFHRDILFAFNAFFYTLDIRIKPYAVLPFCTYDFQDTAILELAEVIEAASALHTNDLFWEKSRDMGATWMILLVFLWFFLKNRPYDFLCGSRKEDYVDKIGDPRTHFHKLRFALYKLPQWLLPEDFQKRKHDNFLKLENPLSGGSITGESNNANFSTQGRYSAILFDEFAKWEGTDEAAWTSAGDATPVRIANSTPFGAAGKHYDLATDGMTRKVVLHWSLHPAKREGLYCMWPKPKGAGKVVDEYHWVGLRSPWYDRECLRRKPREVAQELDISYIGSGFPVFDGLAGERIQELLRNPREATCYLLLTPGWDPDDFSMQLTPNPVEYEDYLKVYFPPSPSKTYVISADVAEGLDSGDFSVVKVLERETETVAASYASQINEVELAKIVFLVTSFYTIPGVEEPWWAVEANGPGLATFDLLIENLDLTNPFMMPKFDVARQTPSFRKGWWTDTSSRRSLVGSIRNWLLSETGWCDPRCCGEMLTFVRAKNGRPQAKEGCSDDEVMCLGIGLEVNKLAPYEEPREEEAPILELHQYAQKTPKEVPKLSHFDYCMATIARNRQFGIGDDYAGLVTGEIEDMIDF